MQPYKNSKKATDDQLASAYAELGSVWLVGNRFGMCGQTVHQRLVKLGLAKKINTFTEEDYDRLHGIYKDYANAGRLNELAVLFGRTKHFICRKAKEIGLTNIKRGKPYIADKTSIRMKKWHSENEHPRGALGMIHTQETKEILSTKSKSMWAKMPDSKRDEYSKRASINGRKTSPINREGASWKAGWREIGGKRKYFRSRWEANYARYLEWLKINGEIIDWLHEPTTFWFIGIKRGCMSYLPDFEVTEMNGDIVYHEVKGWMDDRSKTKIQRMGKYHPNIKLIIIDKKVYMDIKNKISRLIDEWEK